MSNPHVIARIASIIPVSLLIDSEWQPTFSNAEKPRRIPARDNAKLNIIVVDDEVLIAETLAEILNEEGFEARAVTAADAALKLAETFVPDIMFSDVIMPGMNGVDLGVKIRAIAPRCQIFLFSGQALTVDLLEKARKQGHRFDILAKPIRPETVVELVRQAAGRI